MKTFLQPLSSSEEAYYLQLLKDGDGDEAKKARDILIERNLRLVAHIARKYQNVDEDMEDLISIGTIGLIKAIDNFDITQEVQFSTYAVPMIIGEVRRYLRDNNAIRVSRSLRDLAYKAMQMREELFNKNNKEPTVSELAKELEVDREELAMAIDSVQETVSMFEPIFQDGTDTVCVMDQIRDSKNTDNAWEQTITICEAMKKLPEREQMIINLRFFEGRTQTEIAEEIGISQAQISRLEKNALRSLRKYV